MQNFDQLAQFIQKEQSNPHLTAILYLHADQIQQILATQLKQDLFRDSSKYQILKPFSALLESSLVKLTNSEIKIFCDRVCTEAEFDERVLHVCLAWIQNQVTPWIESLQVDIDVEQICYKHFFSKRLSQLFDMLAQYPHSISALMDFKACFSRVSTDAINRVLTAATRKRLLHQGVATSTILNYYVNTVKASLLLGFKLDSSNQLSYLETRKDIAECILELVLKEKSLLDFDAHILDPQEFEEKQPNLLQSLIHNNTSSFMTRVQEYFASQLVKLPDYNHEVQVSNLEVLKTMFDLILTFRFPSDSLSSIAVMISDINCSKRIDNFVQSHVSTPLHALIVSGLYWPNLPDSGIGFAHSSFDEWTRVYEAVFKQTKADRALEWLPLGVVDIDLEFLDGRKLNFMCEPLQAIIVLSFQGIESARIDHFCKLLGITEEAAIRSLQFWVANGVLESKDGVYSIIEYSDVKHRHLLFTDTCDDLEVQKVKKSADSEADALILKYVTGMLNMHKTGTVEKIFGFLKFVPGFKKSLAELKEFLDDCQDELEFAEGVYVLKK